MSDREKIKKAEKKGKLFIVITESNPNMKDRDGTTVLNTVAYNKIETADYYAEKLIDDYINLYVECNSEYPQDIHTRFSRNDGKWFYFDKFMWYLEWDNIRVKKEMWDFDN